MIVISSSSAPPRRRGKFKWDKGVFGSSMVRLFGVVWRCGGRWGGIWSYLVRVKWGVVCGSRVSSTCEVSKMVSFVSMTLAVLLVCTVCVHGGEWCNSSFADSGNYTLGQNCEFDQNDRTECTFVLEEASYRYESTDSSMNDGSTETSMEHFTLWTARVLMIPPTTITPRNKTLVFLRYVASLNLSISKMKHWVLPATTTSGFTSTVNLLLISAGFMDRQLLKLI